MAKDRFEFGLIASPDEIAEYLTSLAAGLKRGEVSLESGEQVLRLAPPSDVKLELKASQKARKGKLEIEITWKRRDTTKASDLNVKVAGRSERA